MGYLLLKKMKKKRKETIKTHLEAKSVRLSKIIQPQKKYVLHWFQAYVGQEQKENLC